MKDIQEKRIEKELILIESSPFYSKIHKKISKDEMYIELVYKHPLDSKCDNIIFFIQLTQNYPFNPPRLFCKSAVSFVLY